VEELLRHDQPVVPDEGAARRRDALLAVGRERDVGVARVLAVERPLRLAVADDEDAWAGHAAWRRSVARKIRTASNDTLRVVMNPVR